MGIVSNKKRILAQFRILADTLEDMRERELIYDFESFIDDDEEGFAFTVFLNNGKKYEITSDDDIELEISRLRSII